MAKQKNTITAKDNLRSYVLISLFSALTCVLSFITIPAPVPFTFQIFGIFLSLTVLGGKKGLISILLYLIICALGLPVFSSFSGGIGHLFGATGGYLLGFIPLALIYCIFENAFGNSNKTKAFGLATGLLACYLTGTLWYCGVHLKNLSFNSLLSSLAVSVLPFIVPDLVKLFFSILLSNKLKEITK